MQHYSIGKSTRLKRVYARGVGQREAGVGAADIRNQPRHAGILSPYPAEAGDRVSSGATQRSGCAPPPHML